VINQVKRKGRNWSLVLAGLGILLLGSLLASVSIGLAHIRVETIIQIILGKLPLIGSAFENATEGRADVIILLLRLPRAIQGALVGASLATSGVVIQSLFKNPMADPFVVGISSGAALGASVAILLGYSGIGFLPLLAFLGATTAAFAVYNIAKTGYGVMVETLLLSGIAVAYFLSSITSLLLYSADEELHQIVFWLMGALWTSSWTNIAILTPAFFISFSVLLVFSRDLNALLLGEEPAHHLGIDVEMIKRMILLTASLLAGVAVAFAGTIGFVGLIIPHISRILFGPDHRILLPSSALMGAIFLVWSDTLARTVIAPAEVPVGIITAFFGAPFFLFLLRSRRRAL
jgi:iron complex transport system permease protein